MSTPTAPLPVWPVSTDYSTHRETTAHRHVCPTCLAVFECPNPWLAQVCQAVEWFEHGNAHCEDPATATADDLASLRANLHRIAPAYRDQAEEAVAVS